MKINIKNENREILFQYATAQVNVKKWTDTEKALKAQVIAIFKELGHVTDSGKAIHSDKMIATVQQSGNAVEVTYVETTRAGSVDWQAYAMALGGNAVDAEKFRKDSTTTTAIRCKHLVNK